MANVYHPSIVRAASNNTDAGLGRMIAEGDSQTYKAKNFLKLSSGKAVVATAGATHILGQALKAGVNNTDGDKISFLKIEPGTIISITAYHSTPASAVTAVASIGTNYGMKAVTSGSNVFHVLDLEETSSVTFTVVGIDPVYPVGEQYGRYYVKVISTLIDDFAATP